MGLVFVYKLFKFMFFLKVFKIIYDKVFLFYLFQSY